MHLNFSARWLLGLVLLSGVLACRVTDTLIAQVQPTPTRTATRRPTFTPVPPPTETKPPPSPTIAPSATPRPPTARPLPSRTPTRPPAPPPPTAVPKPQFKYRLANQGCEHSGQTFIQGTIYDQSGGVINGVTVVMSGAGPDGGWADKRESGTDGDGFYSMIVDAYGPAPGQKRWVWVVEGTTRVSPVAEFTFNNLKPEAPGVCWRGWADFQLQ